MLMNKKSKFIWIYAFVLFAIAFLLIIFSAISQHRIYMNLSTYKDEMSKQTGLFEGIEQSMSALVEKNEDLEKRLKKAEEQNEKLENDNKIANEKLEQLSAQISAVGISIDNLIQAKEYFDKKQYKESALCLEKVNPELLGGKSRALYNSMSEVSFEKAAKAFYNEGYKLYTSGDYANAAQCFENSIKFKTDQYYSDDAMYYLGYSYLELNDIEKARDTFNQFKEMYPASQFISSVQKALDNINTTNEQ